MRFYCKEAELFESGCMLWNKGEKHRIRIDVAFVGMQRDVFEQNGDLKGS